MVNIRVLPPLKDFHRNYRSALLMDNFKLIYRYNKERDEIVIVDIWYTKRSQRKHPTPMAIQLHPQCLLGIQSILRNWTFLIFKQV